MQFDNSLWRTIHVVLALIIGGLMVGWIYWLERHSIAGFLVGILAAASPSTVAFALWCRLAREDGVASMPAGLGLVSLSVGAVVAVVTGAVLCVIGWRTADLRTLTAGGGYFISVAMWLTGTFGAPLEWLVHETVLLGWILAALVLFRSPTTS